MVREFEMCLLATAPPPSTNGLVFDVQCHAFTSGLELPSFLYGERCLGPRLCQTWSSP